MQATVIWSVRCRSTNWLVFLKILVKGGVYIVVLEKLLLSFLLNF